MKHTIIGLAITFLLAVVLYIIYATITCYRSLVASLLFLFTGDTLSAKPNLLPLDENFLAALRFVESSDNPGRVFGDYGHAIGPYQIHSAYWRDALLYNPALGGTYADCQHSAYARAVVTAYLNRYARVAITADDFEVLARVHHGGPNGANELRTLKYWHAVERVMVRQAKEVMHPAQNFRGRARGSENTLPFSNGLQHCDTPNPNWLSVPPSISRYASLWFTPSNP